MPFKCSTMGMQLKPSISWSVPKSHLKRHLFIPNVSTVIYNSWMHFLLRRLSWQNVNSHSKLVCNSHSKLSDLAEFNSVLFSSYSIVEGTAESSKIGHCCTSNVVNIFHIFLLPFSVLFQYKYIHIFCARERLFALCCVVFGFKGTKKKKYMKRFKLMHKSSISKFLNIFVCGL